MHSRAARLYCESRDAARPPTKVERLSWARGEPRGPEEALRVVKWPLIHSHPPDLAAPPYPGASHWVEEHRPLGAL